MLKFNIIDTMTTKMMLNLPGSLYSSLQIAIICLKAATVVKFEQLTFFNKTSAILHFVLTFYGVISHENLHNKVTLVLYNLCKWLLQVSLSSPPPSLPLRGVCEPPWIGEPWMGKTQPKFACIVWRMLDIFAVL